MPNTPIDPPTTTPWPARLLRALDALTDDDVGWDDKLEGLRAVDDAMHTPIGEVFRSADRLRVLPLVDGALDPRVARLLAYVRALPPTSSHIERHVRVSAARVPWVRPSQAPPGGPPSLAFALAGAPGEAVDVAVLAPTKSGGDDGVVRRVAVTLPASGAANVTCTGVGAAAACAVDAQAAPLTLGGSG